MKRTSTVAAVSFVSALSGAGIVFGGQSEQQRALRGHVEWSIAHEGCPVYGGTAATNVFDTLLPASGLRQCFLQVQEHNPDAYNLIKKTPDAALVEVTTEAIKEANLDYRVRENLEWVLQHEGQLSYFRTLAATGRFGAIRAKYKQLESHNPNAVNALTLITDSELDAALNEERVAVVVPESASAWELNKIARYTEPTTTVLNADTTLQELSSKVYGTSALPYVALIKSNNPLFLTTNQDSLAAGAIISIPSVPAPGIAQAFLPRRGLSAELASTQINSRDSDPTATGPKPTRSEVAHGGQIEVPVRATLQSVTVNTYAEGGAQWYIHAVGADKIIRSDLGFNTRPVAAVIGVVDAGVDRNHPALRPVLWRLPPELASNRWPAGSIGYDFYSRETEPLEEIEDSHGSHVTGLSTGRQLAAWLPVLDDAGLSNNVLAFSLKVAGADGKFDFTNAQNAIAAGIKNNVHIFNLSLFGPYSEMLQDYLLLDEHLNSILLVIAAGNSGANLDTDPSLHETFRNKDGSGLRNVIFVAALDDTGKLADFSNRGKNLVEIAAPGVEISSTIHPATFGTLSGTSQAAPFVTLAAAILKSENPEMVPAGLKNRILNTCDMDDALSDQVANGCKLNLLKAIITGSDLVELKDGKLLRGDVDRGQFFANPDQTLARIWIRTPSTATFVYSTGKHEQKALASDSISIKLKSESKCPKKLAGGKCMFSVADTADVVFRVR